MARSEQRLTAELTSALGWDDFVVAGVVDVIVKAKSPAEVEDIVQVPPACLDAHICTCLQSALLFPLKFLLKAWQATPLLTFLAYKT